MAADSGSTRWWENYLVRYFLPSIAGMFIVFWLEQNTGGALTKYLPIFGITDWKDFGTPHLLIWLLFGTLYCYVASYPCLVFHATRVLDFKDVTGNPTRLWSNPYLTSIAFTVAAYIAAGDGYCLRSSCKYCNYRPRRATGGVEIIRWIIRPYASHTSAHRFHC